MRYFHDTEFDEDGKTINLISIGIVAEDGREFYACNTAADERWVRPWVRDNVFPHLPPRADTAWMTRGGIREGIENFIAAGHSRPEFWCYYGASDWVVFYQLWGRLLDMPKGYPKWFRELKQLAVDVDDPDLNTLVPKPPNAHHALADARWNRDVYNALIRRAELKIP
jgi:hypothetical protein